MDYYEILSDTVAAMLEEAAFVFSDPVDSESVSNDVKERLLGFTIGFDNDASGKIEVYAEKDIAKVIAANMIGCEEDDPEAEENAESALKEFTNILAGNVITAIYGTEPVIDLSLPEEVVFVEKDNNGAKTASVWVEIEEAFLMASFQETSSK